MSLTDSEIVTNQEKNLATDDNVYSDLMTEIELGEENVELMAEVKNINTEEEQTESADLSTEQSSSILPQDVSVSEFFNVDTKTDVFDQDIIVSEVDSEGIDFKNDTDVVDCHHDYESKKLLFEDDELSEGVVGLVEDEEGEMQLVENLAEGEEEFEIANEEER